MSAISENNGEYCLSAQLELSLEKVVGVKVSVVVVTSYVDHWTSCYKLFPAKVRSEHVSCDV